ncbi:hypothetical protein [Melissococcus plutonius]|uniref:hypothetical protein n=1 Tax=Melissococcus plutonius TaxID=33970 RepID=UPI003C30AE7B
MSKIEKKNKKQCNCGYIFIESLLSFIVMCVIISTLLQSTLFLLKKEEEQTKQLELARLLYEESQLFYVNNKVKHKTFKLGEEKYNILWQIQDKKTKKLQIDNNKRNIIIEKKIPLAQKDSPYLNV